ncbi:MAG: (Fe-S)-binding protein [Anaerolineae bacterium]
MAITAQLFITCLHEQFYPNALKGMVSVLERLGVQCEMPQAQTCCGQPFYNSGFQSRARSVARQWLAAFGETGGYIVSPSGSCVDMVRHHYLELFPDGDREHERVRQAVERTYEFSAFLVDVLGVTDVGARFPHKVTYHASCHGLRGLGLREQPRKLLAAVRDLELIPLLQEDTCCGFGGAFSVIYPEVSESMMVTKVRNIEATGAEVVVAGDAGCLMNIAGGLRRAKSPIRTMHIAEVLASR